MKYLLKKSKNRVLEVVVKINLNDAERFVATISRDISEVESFTVIQHDTKQAQDVVGTFSQVRDQLQTLNQNGYSVFMTVNKLNGKRKADNVIKVRAVFFDDDINQELILPLEPSMLVQSARGKHGYYLVDEHFPLNKFTDVQLMIANKLKTDVSIKDLSRLMRVPGFMHTKNINEYKEVTILSSNDKVYSLDEIQEAFSEKKLIIKELSKPEEFDDIYDFTSFAQSLPIEEGAENKYGGRNSTALILVRTALANGIPQHIISVELKSYCDRSKLDHKEVERMIEKQSVLHVEKPMTSFFNQKRKINLNSMTKYYLEQNNFFNIDTQKSLLKYWKGDFYYWSGNQYCLIKKDELSAKITKFILEKNELKQQFKKNWVDEMNQQIRGLGYLDSTIEAGQKLDGTQKKANFIFLKNCILTLNTNGEFEKIAISSEYFNLYSLPFDYDTEAKAPVFEKFINEVIPDRQNREFVQEWFGYNLTYDNSQEKFVIFVGQGADGKSVLLTIMTTLLGLENVSSVPLESFDPKRTFPMAGTIGKLSNICDEIGNVRGTEEILKQYVSGSPIYVEKKGKDGTDQRPTARLTFATNKLPQFKDMSDGLWRRLVVVEMNQRLLDESKQDKRFKNPSFWIDANEMGGVLNWALQGYQRLQSRGYFIEPSVSKQFKTNYAQDCNPLSDFFENHVEFLADHKTGGTDLYNAYRDTMPLGSNLETHNTFTQALKKQFPQASRGENANEFNGKRQRVWVGIKLKRKHTCIEERF